LIISDAVILLEAQTTEKASALAPSGPYDINVNLVKTVLAAFVVGACASALVIHGYLNRRLDGDARGKDVNVTRDKFNDESEESLLGPPAALPTYGTSV
jgi:hypothetical protein